MLTKDDRNSFERMESQSSKLPLSPPEKPSQNCSSKSTVITVTPVIAVEEPTGWYDEAVSSHFAPAVIILKIKEDPLVSSYSGNGTISVMQGNLSLFTDDTCKTAAPQSFAAADLRQSKKLYVKGNGLGTGKIKLTLDASDNKQITVANPATGDVEIKAVNVITPKVEAEYNVILLDKKHPQDKVKEIPTTMTRVEIWLEESNPSNKFSKGATLSCDQKNVDFFLDEKGKQTLDLKKLLTYEQLTNKDKIKVYLKGNKCGKITLALEPEKPTDKSHRVASKAEIPMAVISLDLGLYHFEETKPHKEVELPDNDKVLKGVVLHVQDMGANFDRARLVVKKPDDQLWNIGATDYKVVLTVTANDAGTVDFFDSRTGGKSLGTKSLEFAQSDFNSGPRTLWVQGSKEGDTLRHICLDLGIDRKAGGLSKEIKRNGDCARLTVVAIATVSPTTANYKQKVNESGAPYKGPKYKSTAQLTKKLAGIKICFRLVSKDTNATTLPEVWKHKNPDPPLSALTNSDGKAEAVVVLSGVDVQYKSGYNGNIFRVAAYLAGSAIGDDPKLNDKHPTYRKESQDIEIEAPALQCPCCKKPGHSAGYPMTMDAWYETVDFKTPTPTASKVQKAYQTVMLKVNNRKSRKLCNCTKQTEVIPKAPCARFFRPVTDAEYTAIKIKYNNKRKTLQKQLGIKTTNSKKERQINHLTPKAAGGCPTGLDNLQAHKDLCSYCQRLDEEFTRIQSILGRISD